MQNARVFGCIAAEFAATERDIIKNRRNTA